MFTTIATLKVRITRETETRVYFVTRVSNKVVEMSFNKQNIISMSYQHIDVDLDVLKLACNHYGCTVDSMSCELVSTQLEDFWKKSHSKNKIGDRVNVNSFPAPFIGSRVYKIVREDSEYFYGVLVSDSVREMTPAEVM